MNKNQKRIAKMLHDDGEVNVEVPVKDWHNHPKPTFKVHRIPTNKFQGFKKKPQPFPKPNKEEDLSLAAQKKIWDAANGGTVN